LPAEQGRACPPLVADVAINAIIGEWRLVFGGLHVPFLSTFSAKSSRWVHVTESIYTRH